MGKKDEIAIDGFHYKINDLKPEKEQLIIERVVS